MWIVVEMTFGVDCQRSNDVTCCMKENGIDIKVVGNYNNSLSKLQGCEEEKTWCEKLGDASNTLLTRIIGNIFCTLNDIE